MAVDPRFIEMPRWTALTSQIVLDLGGVLPVMASTSREFTAWANQFRAAPQISDLNVPDPRGYDDWRDWAVEANQALYTLGL